MDWVIAVIVVVFTATTFGTGFLMGYWRGWKERGWKDWIGQRETGAAEGTGSG